VSGKGDKPRPLSVPQETFAERWASTFGKPPMGDVEATVIHRLLDLPGPTPLEVLYGNPRAEKPRGVLRMKPEPKPKGERDGGR
jgi:hypothetical protein